MRKNFDFVFRPKVENSKAGVKAKKVNQIFGWYLTLKEVAESGIFNKNNLTALDSAKVANLYEAFYYMNSKIAIQQINDE